MAYCVCGTTLKTLKLAAFFRPMVTKRLFQKPHLMLLTRALTSPAIQATVDVAAPDSKGFRNLEITEFVY